METKTQRKAEPIKTPNPSSLVGEEVKTTVETAVSLKNDPPEGFVSWDKFCDENPDFGKDYRGRIDTHMSMWINEEKGPAFAELLSEYTFGKVEITAIREIPVKAAFTIKVTDFINLMGDPSYKMHRDSVPSDLGIDNLHWKNQKRHLIRRWRRETERRPVERFDKDSKTMRVLAAIYTEIDGKPTCNVEVNDELGLWGNIPQDVWILPPDKMSYTIRAAVDITDFTYEAMRICDVSVDKESWTDEEIEKVRQHLLAKAKDYQIEKQITGTTAGALVQAYMLGAVTERKKE